MSFAGCSGVVKYLSQLFGGNVGHWVSLAVLPMRLCNEEVGTVSV